MDTSNIPARCAEVDDPYPDVNAVLYDFPANVQTVLGEHFRGMYLSGPLALGDFSPDSSDIDFVVVTDADLLDDILPSLRAIHAHFNASGSLWATEVEATYILRDALRRYDSARARHPHIERGAGEVLDMDHLDTAWVLQYYILREHGVIVAGPAPRTLIDLINPREMRRAAAARMRAWWGTMLDDPAPLHRTELGYQAYAVLAMCRMLYTLDTGGVVSKSVAAHWAQWTLGERWIGLIDRALAWRKGRTRGANGRETQDVDMDMVDTSALIDDTLEWCQQIQSSVDDQPIDAGL